jgi:hypothetical protein
MPLFRVRLEAQDGSGHFRSTSLEAPDKEAAKRFCERMELKRVLFEIPAQMQAALCAEYEVDSIDDLPKATARSAADEDKAAFRALKGNDRARLHAHYQSEPYKVTKVEQAGSAADGEG